MMALRVLAEVQDVTNHVPGTVTANPDAWRLPHA